MQMHLREDVPIDKLDEYMPNVFDMSWKSLLGSSSMVYQHAHTYIRQLESIVARWEGEDLGMLQPVVPWPNAALLIMYIILSQMISKKELELLGVSSGTGAASGRGVAVLDNYASATTKDAT
jgi:hypothetical protein